MNTKNNIENINENITGKQIELSIDELKLDDFDINNEIDEINDIVIYSYPYHSDENYDFEFRVTINDEFLIFDDIKCNDNSEDFDTSITLINSIKLPINNAIDLINKNKDIRNNQVLNTRDFVVLDGCNNNDIEENKKTVIRDMYEEILDNLED